MGRRNRRDGMVWYGISKSRELGKGGRYGFPLPPPFFWTEPGVVEVASYLAGWLPRHLGSISIYININIKINIKTHEIQYAIEETRAGI